MGLQRTLGRHGYAAAMTRVRAARAHLQVPRRRLVLRGGIVGSYWPSVREGTAGRQQFQRKHRGKTWSRLKGAIREGAFT